VATQQEHCCPFGRLHSLIEPVQIGSFTVLTFCAALREAEGVDAETFERIAGRIRSVNELEAAIAAYLIGTTLEGG
jgi:hypothetical protein